jgi:hypothetical protein
MPTHYVEDYDGERNDDAVEPVVLSPVVDDAVTAKVVEPESKAKPAKKTSRAQTKG